MSSVDAQLLLDLYRSASGSQSWRLPLDLLCSQLDMRSAVIQRLYRDSGRFRTRWMVRDTHSENCAALHHLAINDDVNPRMLVSNFRDRSSERYRIETDDDLDLPYTKKAHFHQNLLNAGLGQFCGLSFDIGDTSYSLVLHSYPGNPPADQIGSILQAFAPHLQQALSMMLRIDQAEQNQHDLETTLNHLRSAVIICDRDAQILWHNNAAATHFGPQGALHSHRGRLIAAHHEHTRAICQLIDYAARNPTAPEPMRCLTILNDEPLSQVQMIALRLPGDSPKHQIVDRIALVLSHGDARPTLPAATLAKLLGLTPAEARLTQAIAQGVSVKQYATSEQLSEESVRVSLKRLFGKIGCSRQMDLLRLIADSPVGQILNY